MTEPHPRRPHLHKLLEDKLPELGLDVDTYGPYVWGDDDDDAESDNDDGAEDDDELKDVVVGVLQASSETHAEDDEVWLQLIEDIGKAKKLDSNLRREKREKHLQETKTKMEEELARAKLEEAVIDDSNDKKKSSQVDDETKKILMQRYGYDEPAEDEDQGGGYGGNTGSNKKSGTGGGASTTAPTNRDVAKATHAEKTKEMRNTGKSTKADERKKTKDQKASKAQLKEARRKRAQKGERKA
mmetsp:Transcript_16238/g.33376  ORF Transcript_16238/g.33376 Transcript_16238/m.33376 type:complete len:242 (+) Transcript_16238:72-797(+)|eukprot:CAMPEP_0201246916 /NCGR_PEP_ID=MMETSP0852-20130820/52477_1 /ASSEMBLY_ACC=CAM_ASM_000632 /TAXON_ID=183588 /ORGANISM="Pseudo-nitzschia fraudulenta, Strain WWA7" /LENGTH=241 /DNA_ID=CAMNT_0047545231 /DNA_START=36 /DNA_END=761 /DNA_ORIENTATION=-